MKNVHLMDNTLPTRAISDLETIHDIAVGTTLLGAGGGGETYLAELQLQQVIENGAQVRLVHIADVPDYALVAACGWMGAPTVQKEIYANGSEAEAGLEKLEQILGRKVDAIFPIEIGGQNGLSALLLAARRGIPVVDCDGMGRAFPEAHMVTFNIYGCSACPAIFTDNKGNCLVMEVTSNQEEERLGRQLAIAMGGHCHVIDYPMSGQLLRQYAVPGTLTIARDIGHAVSNAGRARRDVFDALLTCLRGTDYYRHARILFDGKIVDLDRNIRDGFTKGTVILEGGGQQPRRMEVEFQNENISAHRDGKVVATVPDIIAIADRESGQAINTENLRYGQRVKVIGISVPPVLRTAEALEVVGPGAFGLDVDYVPVEALSPSGLVPK